MASPLHDIEKIEQYLRRQLSQQESAAFERAMQNDSTLAHEVAAYRTLLSGYAGIRTARFETNLQKWEAEWDEEEDVELIEWYISGALSPPQEAKLQQREIQDPEFKAAVAEYRSLLSGMEGKAQQNFESKLQQWSKQSVNTATPPAREAIVRPLWRRLAVAASLFLAIGIGLRWYAQANFSNNNLYESYYKAPKGEQTLSGNDKPTMSSIAADFYAAHDQLQKGKAEEAIVAFDQLIASIPNARLDTYNEKFYGNQADWGKIMAMLKAERPKSELIAELQKIAENPKHTFRKQAEELKSALENPLRILTN